MRRLAALLAGVFGLPGAALALSLTVEIWATPDPQAAVFGTIHLVAGEMRAIVVRGAGKLPDRTPRRQPTAAETQALTTALQALFDRALDPEAVILSQRPKAPFLTLARFTQLDGRLASGLFYTAPEGLPPQVTALIRTVLPGGLCDRGLGQVRQMTGRYLL